MLEKSSKRISRTLFRLFTMFSTYIRIKYIGKPGQRKNIQDFTFWTGLNNLKLLKLWALTCDRYSFQINKIFDN